MAYITKDEATTLLDTYRLYDGTSGDGTGIFNPNYGLALEWASTLLDQQNWVGCRLTSTQPNAFPRSNVPIDPTNYSLGYFDYNPSADGVTFVNPEAINRIVAELAVFLVDSNPTSNGFRGLDLTGLSLPTSPYQIIPDHIMYLLKPWVIGSNTLFRG